MNITIDVDKHNLHRVIDGADANRNIPLEIEIESILDDTAYDIHKYGVTHFRLGFDGEIILKGSGSVYFTDFENIECSIPVFKKDNKLTLSDTKRVVGLKTLSELLITLLVSNIKIKNIDSNRG